MLKGKTTGLIFYLFIYLFIHLFHFVLIPSVYITLIYYLFEEAYGIQNSNATLTSTITNFIKTRNFWLLYFKSFWKPNLNLALQNK